MSGNSALRLVHPAVSSPETRFKEPPILISYPKSGRTWLRFIFDLAGLEVSFAHARDGGTPLFDMAERRRGIFLHRFPVDCAISHFFHLNHHKFRPGTWRHLKAAITGTLAPRTLSAFLADEHFGVRSICGYMRGWLDHLEGRDEFLRVTYEAMRTDPVGTLQAILRHLDPETVYDVAGLVEQSAFERMRRAEDSSERVRDLRLGHKKKSDPDSRKVRKGKVGGYRDYLSEDEQRHYEAMCADFGLPASFRPGSLNAPSLGNRRAVAVGEVRQHATSATKAVGG